jgi:hypothetical protein
MMHLSETLVLSNRTAKRDAMQKIEAKLELAERKIKVVIGLVRTVWRCPQQE